jgi:guanylate kinase
VTVAGAAWPPPVAIFFPLAARALDARPSGTSLARMDAPQNLAANDPHDFKRRGVLFVLSSPSGAGKSTIARKLLAADDEIDMSVSYTTRPMRPGEVDGKDYHFVDLETFRTMVSDGAFLEWAHVFDHRYGTPKAAVWNELERGRDILFDIDWQGAQQLHQLAGGDVVRVFILPPSMPILRDRLERRATDSMQVIDARMARAANEVSHWDGYDYVLVNDDVDHCFACVQTILAAERLKRSRQMGIIGFIRKLLR